MEIIKEKDDIPENMKKGYYIKFLYNIPIVLASMIDEYITYRNKCQLWYLYIPHTYNHRIDFENDVDYYALKYLIEHAIFTNGDIFINIVNKCMKNKWINFDIKRGDAVRGVKGRSYMNEGLFMFDVIN